MAINRIAAQTLINEISPNLRRAARAERKTIINESKQDPIGTSIKAAHGQFEFVNNLKLQEKVTKLKSELAAKLYEQAQAESFIHRQPMGSINLSKPEDVVHASMVL